MIKRDFVKVCLSCLVAFLCCAPIFLQAAILQENATGFCHVDGTIDSNNSGYSGVGFANTENAIGKGIDWKINVPIAGTYSLTFKYANGAPGNRTAQVLVDNLARVATINFNSTGSWTSWSAVSTSVNLSVGEHDIRLQATNGSGLANIDYLEISGAVSAARCNTSSTTSSSSSSSSSSSGAAVFTSEGVVISQQTVSWSTGPIGLEYILDAGYTVSLHASGVGPMEDADYLNIYYRLNGGPRLVVSEETNAFEEKVISFFPNLSSSGGFQTELEIIVEGATSAADETYTVSNISVSITGGLISSSSSSSTSSTTSSSSSSNSSSSSSSGVGSVTPSHLEAENFSAQSGVQTENTSDAGGGLNLSYVSAGDWVEYPIEVQNNDNFTLRFRVASASGGGTIKLLLDGNEIGTAAVGGTGGWQNWATVTTLVSMSAGSHTLRLVFAGGCSSSSGDLMNLNWIEFEGGAVSSSGSASSSSSSSTSGMASASLLPLRVSGTQIQNSNGTAVHLHGVATTDLHAIYKGLYRPGAIGQSDSASGDCTTGSSQNLLDHLGMINESMWRNVNTMRLTIHPWVSDEVGAHGWNLLEPDFYIDDIIWPTVNEVVRGGRYAILDWHYVGAGWTGENGVRTADFWNRMSAEFANHPNIIFEIFNEPGGGSWNDWAATAQGWVNAIRSGNWSSYGLPSTPPANNLILVGGPSWSSILPQNAGDNFITGGNIAYTNHIYPDHTGGGVPNWADYTLRSHPVFFTEWGFENNGDANVTVGTAGDYGNKIKSYFNSHANAHWIAWCWSPTYRSVMFDTNYVLLGNGNSRQQSRFHGGVQDTYNNYMGQFVVDWLNELGDGNVR